MAATELYSRDGHQNLLLPSFAEGLSVQANQHMIVDHGEAILLDPGGHKVFSRVLAEVFGILGSAKLTHLLLSHQDPDIVAGINAWLMSTGATAYASSLWTRFIPHFGLDPSLSPRLVGLPDPGGILKVGTSELQVLPAHFLHSPGNFHLYDPAAKILYTGDLGASMDQAWMEVEDFEAHVPYMEAFHRRYMGSGRALKLWAARARTLDLEILAPQHGALFRGKERIGQFLAWVEGLECGLDQVERLYAGQG